VNAVALGVIKTPMHPPKTHEALAKFYPLGRMGEVQDIVGSRYYALLKIWWARRLDRTERARSTDCHFH
jgi:hypothetical protein